MAQLVNINQNPRLLKYLVDFKVFAKDKLEVVDVGARGGFETHWDNYQDQVDLIGFEPDERECQRLNEISSSAFKKYYPLALFKNHQERNLFVTLYKPSSSLYEPDLNFLKRFPDEKNLKIESVRATKTISLDSFLAKTSYKKIDFIKLDVEGAELDILKGAVKTLKHVFGISCEVWFYPVHKYQPLFSDVDIFLRNLGFYLFDLSVGRHARKVLSDQTFLKVPTSTEKGQVIWGQAVYLSDAVEEISSKNSSSWDEIRLLKLISIFDLLNLQDCAIELIEVATGKGLIKKFKKNHLLDLLTPSVKGAEFSYHQFMNYLRLKDKQSFSANKQTPKNLSAITVAKRIGKKVLPKPVQLKFRDILTGLRDSIDNVLKT